MHVFTYMQFDILKIFVTKINLYVCVCGTLFSVVLTLKLNTRFSPILMLKQWQCLDPTLLRSVDSRMKCKKACFDSCTNVSFWFISFLNSLWFLLWLSCGILCGRYQWVILLFGGRGWVLSIISEIHDLLLLGMEWVPVRLVTWSECSIGRDLGSKNPQQLSIYNIVSVVNIMWNWKCI